MVYIKCRIYHLWLYAAIEKCFLGPKKYLKKSKNVTWLKRHGSKETNNKITFLVPDLTCVMRTSWN